MDPQQTLVGKLHPLALLEPAAPQLHQPLHAVEQREAGQGDAIDEGFGKALRHAQVVGEGGVVLRQLRQDVHEDVGDGDPAGEGQPAAARQA